MLRAPKEDPMKEFLVAIDGSEGSEAAIDEALDLAQDVGAHVTFAFVRKPPSSLLGYPYYERLLSHELATARETLDSATDRAEDVGIESESEILEGDPVDEILSFADNRGADLIVMSSRGRGAFAGAPCSEASRAASSSTRAFRCSSRRSARPGSSPRSRQGRRWTSSCSSWQRARRPSPRG
jgi:nucleotide-binding universal stress UspA family protein